MGRDVMGDKGQLLRFIDNIYAGRVVPHGWCSVLHYLNDAFGADWGQIRVADLWSDEQPLSDFEPLDLSALAACPRHYGARPRGCTGL